MQSWLTGHRPTLDLAPGEAAARWAALPLPPPDDPRIRWAGAWELAIDDPRVGGFSGLALDRGRLLALTDSGMLVRLPLPPGGGRAEIRPLPAAAGEGRSKVGRDSEALARDPSGGGWWVAFEQVHRLARYDRSWSRVTGRVDLSARGWPDNRGVEALFAAPGRIGWMAEGEGVSDAATLADGQVLTLRRSIGPGGLRLAVGGLRGGPLRLRLGRLDNAEGLAAEERRDGSIRLWIVTDNDFRRWRPSRLFALDVRQAAVAAD